MNPRIVCNTGPLIALSLIDCQDVLSELYQPTIPRKVIEEWSAGEAEHTRSLPTRCEIGEVIVTNPFLAMQLVAGEAAVIQTAMDLDIGIVLMDERKGRKVARRLCGLVTLGTAGLLVQAKRAGLVRKIKPLFIKLNEESYWISPAIMEWALEEAEE